MSEALAKVREELGNNAIILSTRSDKKGGVLDLIGRSVVEVTAAIDDNPTDGSNPQVDSIVEKKRYSPAVPREASLYPPANQGVYHPPSGTPVKSGLDNVSIRNLDSPVKMDQILDDIKTLKSTIKELADSALTHEMDGLPVHLLALLKRMNDSGLDERISKRLVRQLLHELNGVELSNPTAIKKKATKLLLSGMGQVSPIQFKGAKPRIVTFIGPTGSGKTTTIAKLATDFTLNLGKKVTILTIDTKRVDAVGQLKAYCRIINIPLFIAYSPDDISGIMPGIVESDITLVDTPGAGPMDRAQMLEMVEFLHKLVPQEVHLTVSVTTSLMEMNRILNNFNVMKPNRLLFTKLDETQNYGPLLSFALMSRKPLSYVTVGQNVPGDFNVFDPGSMAESIFDPKDSE